MKPKPKQQSDPHLARMFAWTKLNDVRCEAKQESGQLQIFGPIGDMGPWGESITAETVANEIRSFSPEQTIELMINSPGGDAYDGVAIYNLLRLAPNPVNVTVMGIAASAASVIAMAGDSVAMAPGSTLMIHKAWTFAVGNAREMRETADMLDTVDGSIASIYERRTGKTRDELIGMMDPDTFMSAEEAVAQGFADRIAEKTEPAQKSKAQATALSRVFGAKK